jgi:hypothetical protein
MLSSVFGSYALFFLRDDFSSGGSGSLTTTIGLLKKQTSNTIATTSTTKPQTLPTMIFTLDLHHIVSHAFAGSTGVTGVGKVLLSMFSVGLPVG